MSTIETPTRTETQDIREHFRDDEHEVIEVDSSRRQHKVRIDTEDGIGSHIHPPDGYVIKKVYSCEYFVTVYLIEE